MDDTADSGPDLPEVPDLPELDPDATIRIATFNIQVFGQAKAANQEVMQVLAEIVREYDIIAIQEIKDAQGEVPELFLAEINADPSRTYAMLVSPRTGLQADDENFEEQYLFIYDVAVIELVGTASLYDDVDDQFQREPWVAQLRAVDGNFSFVLATIHASPPLAVAETGALHDVVTWAQDQCPDEDDFIVLGDYNASCTYATVADLDALEFRGDDYTWIVPDDADTNFAETVCAYDRIVITRGADDDYAGEWGVDQAFSDNAVSDHYPVWAEFYTGRDAQR